jgi:hypothetical protein
MANSLTHSDRSILRWIAYSHSTVGVIQYGYRQCCVVLGCKLILAIGHRRAWMKKRLCGNVNNSHFTFVDSIGCEKESYWTHLSLQTQQVYL